MTKVSLSHTRSLSAEGDEVVLTPLTDAANFNASFTWSSDTGLGTHVGDLVGTLVRGKPVLPHGPNEPGTVAWQMDSGSIIEPHKGNVIYYNFLDTGNTTGAYNNPKEGLTHGWGYTPFLEEQRDAARIAIENWDDLISTTFVEVNGDGRADITLANTYTGPAQASAFLPHNYADIYTEFYDHQRYNYLNRWEKFTGDVWIADPRINSSNLQLDPGFYGLQTLNHELGHSLGLSHPGTYNFSDDVDGDGEPDPITYTYDAQYFQDSHQFTIMSYFDAYETGAQNIDWNVMRVVYASTPMVDDVFVIQQKYGADMTTRTGDTTYGFNATDDVTNEALRFETGEMSTVFTIWDAGGNDTLDLSGYHTDSVIDLREGGYSSAGGWGAYDSSLIGVDPTFEQINENNADAGLADRTERLFEIYFNGDWSDDGGVTFVNEGLSWKEITGTGDQYLMEQNIGIAYGAVVENAVGGHGNDRINGNHVDNSFTGGAGDDVFIIADHSGDLPKLGGGTRSVTDTSTDTITDFGNGDDTLDLSSFDNVAGLSDVSWDDATNTLTIDSNNDNVFNGDDMSVIINGTFTTADILFG